MREPDSSSHHQHQAPANMLPLLGAPVLQQGFQRFLRLPAELQRCLQRRLHPLHPTALGLLYHQRPRHSPLLLLRKHHSSPAHLHSQLHRQCIHPFHQHRRFLAVLPESDHQPGQPHQQHLCSQRICDQQGNSVRLCQQLFHYHPRQFL